MDETIDMKYDRNEGAYVAVGLYLPQRINEPDNRLNRYISQYEKGENKKGKNIDIRL